MANSLKNEDNSNQGLRKVLGFPDILSIAIGQTIGSGVMAMTGIAIGMTGRGTVLAYILSSILVVIMCLPGAAMGSALPTTGGSYRYVTRLLTPGLGIFLIILYITYNITLALFAISFADYMQSIFPVIPFKLAAFGILTILFIFNFFGIGSAAKLQTVMTIVLISALAMFIIYGIPSVNFEAFTAESMFPKGFIGLLTVAGLLTFATGGANVVVNLGGEMKNPGKDIPMAILLGTVIVGIVYAFIALVATGVLPVEQVAYKNLTEVSKVILPRGLYIYFIIGGAMFAITTTLNSTISWVTKPLVAASQDGLLPKKFGEINKRYGTPHWGLLFFYIVGVVPILLNIPLAKIGVIGSGVSLFMGILPAIASMFLYKKYPKETEKAPFHMKPRLHLVVAIVTLILMLIQSVLLFKTLGATAMKIAFAYALVAFIVSMIIEKKLNKTFYTGDAKVDFV